jgi:predicted CXXCH cytochrome family protein
MEVCMECHLETTTSDLPGAIKRFDRGVFSYRPGEPLADYMLYFDHAPGTGHEDKFEFVGAPYRLRESACFRASAGRLTCLNCHDPHQQPSREDALRRTNGACVACHGTAIAKLVGEGRHTAAEGCANCHMPQRRGTDVTHATVTDHRIERPGKSAMPDPIAEANDGNTLPYAGEVAPYYPKTMEPVYEAIAQVSGLANLPAGLARLARSAGGLASQERGSVFRIGGSFRADVAGRAGDPFLRAGSQDGARELALYIRPGDKRIQGAGKLDQAVIAMERAAAMAPYETALRNGLGVAYAMAGRAADAVRTLRDVVARNPEDGTALNNLGQALAQANEFGDAETAFREAVRLLPESGELRMNLAEALMRRRQFGAAALQLEEVIRGGPSTQAARSAWFSGLAAAGATEARARYDESLRRQVSTAHDNLGSILIGLGEVDGAIKEYRLAAEADPKSLFAALNLGIALAGHGQPDEARKWLEAALRLDPRQAAAHLKLGELLLAAGSRKEGIAHLTAAAQSADQRIRSEAEKQLESAK